MERINIFHSASLLILVLLFSCGEANTREVITEASAGQTKQATAAAQQGGDMGKKPWVLDIEQATLNNPNYRNAQWTGEHMQMVLMSIKPGEEIDLELHGDVDQFLRIEQGQAQVRMGKSKDDMSFDKNVSANWAIFIPSGYWHHIKNTGNKELKLYTIYAPAQHPAGTVKKTYEEAKEHH